jgi:chromosome segregation ATPase
MIRGISPEDFFFLFFASVILAAAFMSSSSYAAGSAEQPLSFSNKDLERYENSDRQSREPLSADPKNSEVRKNGAGDSREQREKEYWCKKAEPQRRKIQQIKDEINEKERELAEESTGVAANKKKARTLDRALSKTRKRLKDAEGKFSDLADEAYRKGVPMGWLRCQFE